MKIPEIETARLRLVAPEIGQFETHCAYMSDPRVTEFLGSGPQSRTEIWRRFCSAPGMWHLVGYGYWSVIDRATGFIIGMCGLGRFERELPELEGFPEAGWAFGADSWGRGIASEAMIGVLGWADAALGRPEIRCIISPENTASIRVAEKCGFTRIGETADAIGDVVLFSRPGGP